MRVTANHYSSVFSHVNHFLYTKYIYVVSNVGTASMFKYCERQPVL
jgi:hypothetical protein